MRRSIRTSYTHTILASYLGYITQAVVNNFAPLLFLTFRSQMGLTLEQITLLTTLNFSIQLLVDFLSVKVVDRIGYRPCVVAAHLFSAAGLSALAFLPQLLGNAYAGLMLAVTLYAMGGGLIEVLVSPIVEACPTDKKEAAMSLLHSFYCWGHVAVVLVSTAFFQLAGIGNWRIMACLWAVLPLVNALYFSQVPIRRVVDPQRQLSVRSLFGQKLFWLLLLMMVCAGAAEQGMSQWGVRLCGIRSRGEQNDRRFGRPLRLCAFDGHLARTLRKIQRTLAAARSNDSQRRNVHRLLRHSVMERLSRARAGGLCTLRVFGRHLLARHIQYGGACDSGRRDGDVRADGAGR